MTVVSYLVQFIIFPYEITKDIECYKIQIIIKSFIVETYICSRVYFQHNIN